MSDDQRPARQAEHEEPKDEVEAHHKRVAANDEPAQEGGDDEVEAHRGHRASANDEPAKEGDHGDRVRRRHHRTKYDRRRQ